MPHGSLLALAGTNDHTNALLRMEPPLHYTDDERRLSAHVEREIDSLIFGQRNVLLLLKLYPGRGDLEEVRYVATSGVTVRAAIAERIACETLDFFGPLQGGIVVQEPCDDIIAQSRRYTTAYPHINLERYELYDARTRDPLLGAWRARRLQNQRRETRTNRMIDVALLTLEVGKALFSLLP
jgi:hypothetical protein